MDRPTIRLYVSALDTSNNYSSNYSCNKYLSIKTLYSDDKLLIGHA